MQGSGAVVYSMDALFGLPRKKAAGKSFWNPLHESLFFGDQIAVDQYVASHKAHQKQVPKVSHYVMVVLQYY